MRKGISIYDSTIPIDLPLLDGPGGSLMQAAAADGRLFSLTGGRAAAWGTGLRGVAGIRAGGWTIRDVVAGLGPASNVLVAPHSVRRELAGAGRTVLETMLLGLHVPAAIFQWRRSGSDAPLEIVLSWTISSDVPAEIVGEPCYDRIRIIARPARRDLESRLALAFTRPAPDDWEVLPEGDALRITARLRCPSGGALSLIFAMDAGAHEEIAALRVMSSPRVEEVRAEQALAMSREERLALHTGVAELDEGLEWAKARLGCAVDEGLGRNDRARRDDVHGRPVIQRLIRRGGGPCARPLEPDAPRDNVAPPTLPADFAYPRPFIIPATPLADPLPPLSTSPFSPLAEPCWVGLGGLAAGDHEPAEVALGGDYDTPYHLLLAARFVSWTGSAGLLHEHADRLDAAVAKAASQVAPGDVIGLALRELADAWECVGEKGRAVSLRKLGGASADPRASGRRLPVLAGASSASREEEELAVALLSPEPSSFYRAPTSTPDRAVERALRAWASCRSGDPDSGYVVLRDHLEAGFREGWGMWSEVARPEQPTGPAGREGQPCPDHAASAALVPCALLFGLLGASADAPLGRIRLAPRFPSSWASFAVTGIRVGDASISLRYERERRRHTFRVRQEGGRIPFMLVFEPEVPEARIADAFVDGPVADLMRSSARGRSKVRVQIPLAQERVVTLVGDGE